MAAATSAIRMRDEAHRISPRAPGVLLFVLAAQFMTVIMLAASMAPGYDVAGGAISDLGVISETALLFNLSLLAVGALNILGGYLLYRTHGHLWILGVYLVAGLGAIGAGLVPLDKGDLHSVFALVAFIFFNIEAIASASIVDGSDAGPVVPGRYRRARLRRDHGDRRRRQPGRLRPDRPRWRGADDRLPGDALADGVRRVPDGGAVGSFRGVADGDLGIAGAGGQTAGQVGASDARGPSAKSHRVVRLDGGYRFCI